MRDFKINYHGGYVPDDGSRLYLEGITSISNESILFYNVSKDGVTGGVNRVAFIGIQDGFVKDICVDATNGEEANFIRVLDCISHVFKNYNFFICLQTGSHYSLLEKTLENFKVKIPKGKYACVFSLASVALPNIARKRDAYVEVLSLEKNEFLKHDLLLADITRAICEEMIRKSDLKIMEGLIANRDNKKREDSANYFRRLYNEERGLE